jgi:hypothetical protein
MNPDLDLRRLVALTVAGAPALTNGQVDELRRILRPNDPTRAIAPTAVRKAAVTRRAA